MPSTWYRSPQAHRDVVQRRAGVSTTSHSFDSSVPTSTASDPTSSSNSSSDSSPASSESSSSPTSEPKESPANTTTESGSTSAPTDTASESSSSPSSSTVSPTSETNAATSSSAQSDSLSSSTQSSSSSRRVSASSRLRTSGSSSAPLTENMTQTSSTGIPSSTIPPVVTTPTDAAAAVAITTNWPPESSSAAGMSGSLQSGASQPGTSSASSNHKNVIIGVTATFGGLVVLGAIFLVILRFETKRRKAKAEQARQERWRRSADSWIGTRMGESRAATPAIGGILGTWRSARRNSLGLSAPPTGEMQQAQSAMVSEYLERHTEAVLQVPAPSHHPDHDASAIDVYRSATPPDSTTALVFSGVESELPYADGPASVSHDIPVIRVTDPGAEHSRPPTNFSDLDYHSPHSTVHDIRVDPVFASPRAFTRSPLSTADQHVENPFIQPSEDTLSSSQVSGTSPLRLDSLQAQNPFHSAQRDSTSSAKSPSKYFRVSDPFGAAVRRVPLGVVPTISVAGDENSVVSLAGHIVHPPSTSRRI